MVKALIEVLQFPRTLEIQPGVKIPIGEMIHGGDNLPDGGKGDAAKKPCNKGSGKDADESKDKNGHEGTQWYDDIKPSPGA